MAVNEAYTENQKCVAPSLVRNCVLVSSPMAQIPFLRPLKPVVAPSIIRELHCSVACAADKCLRFLHLLASENPIIKKILAFSCDFNHHLTQIRCRNYGILNFVSHHNFAAVLPGDSVAGLVVANGILNFLNIYNTLLIIRVVLTWFPNSPPAIISPLSTLCDPYLNMFRGIIPPLGGTLDFSPILAFLVLNAFTSTAAALPAELPKKGASQGNPSSHTRFSDLTTSQKKWMRRLQGSWSKRSDGIN